VNDQEWGEWRGNLAHPDTRAVIGYLHPGTVDHCFAESLLNSYQLDQSKGVGRLAGAEWRIAVQCGSAITAKRNLMVRHFLNLRSEPEWLWMVDSDMRWEPDALERMLVHARPDRVIGGLCFCYGERGLVLPTIFHRDELGHNKIAPYGYKIPTSTLLQVDGTGAAFLLVHREALIKIAALEPWSMVPIFRETETLYDNPDYDPAATTGEGVYPMLPHWTAEDLFFCDQIEKAGLTLWIDTGVEVGHRKAHYLTRELYESDTSAMEWA
jgi:hypothetical protein